MTLLRRPAPHLRPSFSLAGLGAALAIAVTGLVVATPAAAQTTSPYSAVGKLGTAQTAAKPGPAHFGHLLALPGATAEPAHVREVEGHANAVAFFFDAKHPSRQTAAVAALSPKTAGAIFVNDVFMNTDGTSKAPGEVARNLSSLKAQLGAKLDAGAVPYLAFDEPMWRRQGSFCSGLGGSADAIADCRENGPRSEVVAEMRPKLEGWIEQLRTISSAKVSVVVIEAHPMIRDALELPVNADVYGYDCYDDFEKCSRDRRTRATYSNRQLWDGLKARVSSFNSRFGGHRRMALIVPATLMLSRTGLRDDNGFAANNQIALDKRLAAPSERPDQRIAALAKKHLDAFADDPMTLLVGNFMWNAAQEGDVMWIGTRGLPETRALLEQTGKRLLGARSGGPTGAPIVEFEAQTGAVAKRTGAIWIWSSSLATSCRSISDPSVPVMPPSGALYRAPDATPTTLQYTISCTGPGGTTTKSTTYSSKGTPRRIECGRGRPCP